MSDQHDDALAARAAIHDLLVRLAIAQDERDWDTLAGCYAHDAVYRHPSGELGGVDAILDRARTALAPLDASQHLLGTILVDVAGDTATSTTYFHAQHVRRGTPGGDLFVIAGTYADGFARHDGLWRIAERVQHYTWRDGNPDVIRRDSQDGGSR